MPCFYMKRSTELKWVNPIHATGLVLYPFKTSEKQSFPVVFSLKTPVWKETSDMKWVNIWEFASRQVFNSVLSIFAHFTEINDNFFQ